MVIVMQPLLARTTSSVGQATSGEATVLVEGPKICQPKYASREVGTGQEKGRDETEQGRGSRMWRRWAWEVGDQAPEWSRFKGSGAYQILTPFMGLICL